MDNDLLAIVIEAVARMGWFALQVLMVIWLIKHCA